MDDVTVDQAYDDALVGDEEDPDQEMAKLVAQADVPASQLALLSAVQGWERDTNVLRHLSTNGVKWAMAAFDRPGKRGAEAAGAEAIAAPEAAPNAVVEVGLAVEEGDVQLDLTVSGGNAKAPQQPVPFTQEVEGLFATQAPVQADPPRPTGGTVPESPNDTIVEGSEPAAADDDVVVMAAAPAAPEAPEAAAVSSKAKFGASDFTAISAALLDATRGGAADPCNRFAVDAWGTKKIRMDSWRTLLS